MQTMATLRIPVIMITIYSQGLSSSVPPSPLTVIVGLYWCVGGRIKTTLEEVVQAKTIEDLKFN